MREFLPFCVAFDRAAFDFTPAVDFVQSEPCTLRDQVAASIMAIERN